MRVSTAATVLGIVGSCISAVGAPPDPQVRVLTPGFEARRLPVDITNLNGLCLAPDGTIYLLAYDGRILRLRDTDGDGVEDRAEPFWDKGTLVAPIAAVWTSDGLYVTSNRKLSRLRDTDGDGRADREDVILTGWPQIPTGGNNVDAMGLARDAAGDLYMALGCADFTNPYLVKDGKATYQPGERLGSILKLSPDGKKVEVVAGGTRFCYALEFNREGDLFATDQEGETWLKGANPFDELLHIIPGRHYGWPPRHPEHLPNVHDEPAVVRFKPQHQSACGLAFNDVAPGAKAFGPKAWRGNAFVAGFSRGKVWRVPLVKSASGYVGEPIVFAVSRMMVSDVLIAPNGAMYLTCHSGEPDWGTGPKGEGALVKIIEADPAASRPVATWVHDPLEVRVAFDRPIDASGARSLVGKAIAFGPHNRAGDRFETLRPPYKAVADQKLAPVGSLRITAAKLLDDGRTLSLTTDPHPREARYVLPLTGLGGRGAADSEVDYGLDGVVVEFAPGEEEEPIWTGWWPHIDTKVARAFTAGSVEHERAFGLLESEGRWTLRTTLNLPEGKAKLRLHSSTPIVEVTVSGESLTLDEGAKVAEPQIDSTGEPLAFDVVVQGGAKGSPLELAIACAIDGDPNDHPLTLDQLSLPWAPTAPPASTVATPVPEAIKGGDPKNGEAVFFSEQAKCSACHKFRGKGGEVGPDLSNLSERDPAAIYRDIAEPSATINPDYVPYTVAMKEGRVHSGVVRSEGGDKIRVVDTDAKATVIARSDIEELRPTATSIMPVGLAGALGEAKMRDLIAYLTSKPK